MHPSPEDSYFFLPWLGIVVYRAYCESGLQTVIGDSKLQGREDSLINA